MGQCRSSEDFSDPAVAARRFRLDVARGAAAQHAIPHKVVSQVLTPDLVAFMEDSRVAVRSHSDKLCCADGATFIAGSSGGYRLAWAAQLCAADIAYLAQLPHLVQLTLEGNISASVFGVIAVKLPQLQHLNLSRCCDVDAAGLAEVAKLPQLHQLNLSRCRSVNATMLAEVAKLSQLHQLNLSWCYIDAPGLAEVAKLPQLRHLNLRGCDGVDAACLAELAKLPQLQHLDLSVCDVDVSCLAEVVKLPQLQHLNLSVCFGVDASSPHVATLRKAGTVVLTTR